MRISNESIAGLYGNYGIAANVLSTLFFQRDYRKSRAECQLYFDERDMSTLDCRRQPSGFKTRAELTDQSSIVAMRGPIFHGLFMQEKMLTPMTAISFHFDLAEPEFVLKSGQVGGAFAFQLSDIKLNVPKVTVTPALQLQIERRLSSSPACYTYRNIVCRDYIVNNNVTTFKLEDCFAGDFLPDEVYVFMNEMSHSNGRYDSSVLNFMPNGIQDLYITVDGLRFPPTKYKADWTSKNNYLRPYYDLFSATSQFTDVGGWIDPQRFATAGFAIFKINLSYPKNECHDALLPKKLASARLIAEFATPTPTPLRLYILTRPVVTLLIDEQRRVIRDFPL